MTNRRLAVIVEMQDPLTLPSEASVREACHEMWTRHVGAVLVTGPNKGLVGIFTGRDAVRALSDGKDATNTPLASTMTPNPHTLGPDDTAIDALRTMSTGGYRHVPVVADGRILGIVSRGDFLGLELDHIEQETKLWENMG